MSNQMALSTELTEEDGPLQQETAIPAPKRARNNSIIPLELLNNTSGGGSRERAALATVFGVAEYSQSKIFWEKPPFVSSQHQHQHQHQQQQQQSAMGMSALSELNGSDSAAPAMGSSMSFTTKGDASRAGSPLPARAGTPCSVLTTAATRNDAAATSSTFALPPIPTVSQFHDLLVRDEHGSDLMFPSNASSVLMHSSMMMRHGPPSLRHAPSDLSLQTSISDSPLAFSPTMADQEQNTPIQHQEHVAAPLLFIGYPPSIFELLKPDDDERIIVWGPDPKALSASMATTTTTTTTNSREHPTASSSMPTTSQKQEHRPSLRGFSSNTTTSISSPVKPEPTTKPRLLQGLKKSLQANTLMHRPSTDNLRQFLRRRTLRNNKSVDDSPSTVTAANESNIAKVIEAASVEKLVEKLTITLDYDFMTDFFLTYRSFISPTQLCKLLILRFRWALENDAPDRKIVRIRTFVVMRHWLLNYFVHDFIPCRGLRVVLTAFLNALPRHPLVKSSPRDQRIVKGLKRVVRRLKRVYYGHGANAQRVQVIAPPPPPAHQERVEEKVRATLSEGVFRRKTALVRGLDVRGKHNGNLAVQDARHAPMVVIGNVPTGKRPFSQHHADMSTTSVVTTTMASFSQELTSPGGSTGAGAVAVAGSGMGGVGGASMTAASDDDSLESDISPGTTEIDSDEDDYFDSPIDLAPPAAATILPSAGQQEDTPLSKRASQSWKFAGQSLSKLEVERRRREDEEERQRMAFFSSSNLSSSSVSMSIAPLSPSQQPMPPSAPTPDASLSTIDTTTLSATTSNANTIDHPILQQDDRVAAFTAAIDAPSRKAPIGDMSSRIPRAPSSRWCKDENDQIVVASRRDSRKSFPLVLPAAALDALDDDENDHSEEYHVNHTNTTMQPQRTSEDNDLVTAHTGLSLARHLSRKSIERRKSEKNLRELANRQSAPPIPRPSLSTPASTHNVSIVHDPMPLVAQHEPPTLTPKRSIATLRTLPDEKTLVPMPMLPTTASGHNEDFEAIPYHATSTTNNTSTSKSKAPRPSLSKKLASMMVFSKTGSKQATPTPTTPSSHATIDSNESSPWVGGDDSTKMQLDNEESNPMHALEEPRTPTPIPAAAMFPATRSMVVAANLASSASQASQLAHLAQSSPLTQSAPPSSPTPATTTTTTTTAAPLVSRIAQELRESGLDMDIECDCTRCTGRTIGPKACRRFSMALLGDEEKRYSHALKLQQMQAAAAAANANAAHAAHAHDNANVNANATNGDHPADTIERPGTAQNGPMYLGQLAYQESASDLVIEEMMEDDDDESMASSSLSLYSTTSGSLSKTSSAGNNDSLQKSKHAKKTASTQLQGNRSFDRLTGIATKGDGTSIHQQVLSITSLSSIMDRGANRDSISLSIATPVSNISPPRDEKNGHDHENDNDDDDELIDDDPLGHDVDVPTDGLQSPTSTVPPTSAFAMPSPYSMTELPPPHEHGSFILYYRSSKLAQQLCFIERDVLLGVDWEEMVHCRWTKMNTSSSGSSANANANLPEQGTTDSAAASVRPSVDTQHQPQNNDDDTFAGIEQVIERFNTVCQWVASEIVCCKRLDLRVKVIEKFIRLAQKCRMYSNFATLVQILLGLQSPWVSRLKRTWARVASREMRLLEELSLFTSPMRNWKHIRDKMTTVAEEYGMSPTEVQVEMPGTNPRSFRRTKIKIPFGGCIPFLGIYLSDLVFNSEQPPYLEPSLHSHHRIYHEQTAQHQKNVSPVLKQPLVNFRKHRITATVIKRVLTFQNLARRYAFDLDDDIYELCLLLDPLDTEAIRLKSMELE
ncbi:hypothetical protein BC940DRAFT_83268 [Gongronella butleri]|nr:hypothetical protein BC940DRAFT_83268 [Gongronella butleri]